MFLNDPAEVTHLQQRIAALQAQNDSLRTSLEAMMASESFACHERIVQKQEQRARLIHYHLRKHDVRTNPDAAWADVKRETDADFDRMPAADRARIMADCATREDFRAAAAQAKRKGLKDKRVHRSISLLSDKVRMSTANTTNAPAAETSTKRRAAVKKSVPVSTDTTATTSNPVSNADANNSIETPAVAKPARSRASKASACTGDATTAAATVTIDTTTNSPATIQVQSDDGGSSGASEPDAPLKDASAYVTALRRVQKTAKRLSELLKTQNNTDGRKLALEITREASKALSMQQSRQTGYQLFIKLNSPKFRQEIESNPDNSGLGKGAHTQLVFRKIAESWQALDDAQKKHYNDMVASATPVQATA